MDHRLIKTQLALRQAHLDCLVLFSPHNISYLTRTKSRDSFLIVSGRKNIYLTDSRYTEEAKRTLRGFEVKRIDGPVFEAVARACMATGYRRIGFEEQYLTLFSYHRLRAAFDRRFVLVPVRGIVENLRQVKEEGEIDNIRKAVQITVRAFRFAREIAVAGRREIEVAADIERFIRLGGASGSSFEIIVAGGPNSAYPHHATSSRRLKRGEPVLIDMGVDYKGYKSDLTRVFFLGKMNPRFREIYDIVLEAQERALRNVRPGVFINSIDSAARHFITRKGYGGFFSHSLGHGVGLEVHEAPRISQKEKSSVETGMVFTIEPGIYRAGSFGVRVEDMVLVTQKGCEVISGSLDK